MQPPWISLLSLKLQFNRLHRILSIKMQTFGACGGGGVRTHPVHPPWLRAWIYCAVQKEKVCGHVTMVAKRLGEFTVLFTNTRSLVPSRPRGFRMWRPLSKHANSKVQKRRMKHGNTQNGSKSSLCTDPPPLRENLRRGPFSDFSWEEGGL